MGTSQTADAAALQVGLLETAVRAGQLLADKRDLITELQNDGWWSLSVMVLMTPRTWRRRTWAGGAGSGTAGIEAADRGF